jgi:hypothetical protein
MSKNIQFAMEKFASGEMKILVCTHIIESGIDIANANTMIVQFAELFGLAQLYQVALFSCMFLLCLVSIIFNVSKLRSYQYD